MGNEIDFGPVLTGLEKVREVYRPGDLARLNAALVELGQLPIPQAYIDGLRDELTGLLVGQKYGYRAYVANVYLAFFGDPGADRASYMKVGIAKDVFARMLSHSTSNPLTRMWVFAAGFDARQDAQAVEAGLLKHLVSDRVKGEWVNVYGVAEPAAAAIAESLAEVAAEINGRPVKFKRVPYP